MNTGEFAAQERLRLFVAVEIPDRVRKDVDAATAPLQRHAPDAKWTAPGSWHLTLAFLGWVDPDQLSSVERACAGAVVGVQPFELALDGTAGTFGGRVLWAGLEATGALETLALRLREELAAAGFEVEERGFRPHLTLARARKGGRLPNDVAAAYAGPSSRWRVERLVLMRSRLRRAGAAYSIEAAWRLGA